MIDVRCAAQKVFDLQKYTAEQQEDTKVIQCFYLLLYHTGQLFSFSVGYDTLQALSTVFFVVIWPSEDETLQILWNREEENRFISKM